MLLRRSHPHPYCMPCLELLVVLVDIWRPVTKLSFHVVPSSWEMLVYVANAAWHHLSPGWERMIKLAWSSLASSSHCILLLFSAGLFQEVCVSQASSWVWLTRLGSHEGPVGGETGGEIGGWVGDVLWLQVVDYHRPAWLEFGFCFLRHDNFLTAIKRYVILSRLKWQKPMRFCWRRD